MWDLTHGTNDLISETETDPQTQRTDLWLPRRGMRDVGDGWTGSLRLTEANIIYKVDKQ